MPRYNVQNSQGEWACFSSIVDDFITEFMPRAEYQAWREQEYGRHCGEIEEANIMDYEEAMGTSLCVQMQEESGEFIDCSDCKFWNKELNKCEIVEKKSI